MLSTPRALTLRLLTALATLATGVCAAAESLDLAGLRVDEPTPDSPGYLGPPDDCCCLPPGTLMRWSYGDEEGGPPGMDEPLASDRPDFTEASTTVGRGVVQLEAGYTYTYDSEGGVTSASHSFPEALFRIGMFAEWFEFRIAQNAATGRVRSGGVNDNFYGLEDLYLGFKLGLTPQAGILPEMALIGQMTVPTGHATLTNDAVLAGFNWLYGWDVNDFISTAGSTQLNRAIDGGSGDVYYEFAQSWTIGYSLTDRLGAYTEWFVLVPSGAVTERTQHYFDGGFTYRVTNNLQLDIRGGVGLSDASDDYFLGSGFVARF